MRKHNFVPGTWWHFVDVLTGEFQVTVCLDQWELAVEHAIPFFQEPLFKETKAPFYSTDKKKWVYRKRKAPLDQKKHPTEDRWVPDLVSKRHRLTEQYAETEIEVSYNAEIPNANGVDVDFIWFYAEDIPALQAYKATLPANGRHVIWLPAHDGRSLKLSVANITAVLTALSDLLVEFHTFDTDFQKKIQTETALSLAAAEDLLTLEESPLVRHRKKKGWKALLRERTKEEKERKKKSEEEPDEE
jgi:hypothetical protein